MCRGENWDFPKSRDLVYIHGVQPKDASFQAVSEVVSTDISVLSVFDVENYLCAADSLTYFLRDKI